jgi:hypothetical protein
MKITRRSDKGKGGYLLILVPADRVADVEAALTFLEAKRQKRGSHVVVDLIVRAAKRNRWNRNPRKPQRRGPTLRLTVLSGGVIPRRDARGIATLERRPALRAMAVEVHASRLQHSAWPCSIRDAGHVGQEMCEHAPDLPIAVYLLV